MIRIKIMTVILIMTKTMIIIIIMMEIVIMTLMAMMLIIIITTVSIFIITINTLHTEPIFYPLGQRKRQAPPKSCIFVLLNISSDHGIM